ncbi:hypothetical protein F4859DRAFT_526851 [Xylaria cf. heliscus]|nr:hypothetical protein F4859DRAFT_526851 [Xylaria cf. heliscus]
MPRPLLPKPPARPPLTVNVNTSQALPNAGKAALPPRPLITPTSLSPTGSQFPQLASVPSPSPTQTPRKRKRTYSRSNDSVVVPLQHFPVQDSTKNTPSNGATCNSVGEGETAERATKVRRITINNNVPNNRNDGNNHATYNYHQPSTGTMMHQQAPNMTGPEAARYKVQLIYDMVRGGATTLTTRVQTYLAQQLHENLECISAEMMWLVARQITNKTNSLSYGIIHWAHNHNNLELVEYMLESRLYNFHLEEAFDQGLMDVTEVEDLMDNQTVLHCVRKEREERAQKKATEHPNTKASVDADHCESDTGSADMDFSEEDIPLSVKNFRHFAKYIKHRIYAATDLWRPPSLPATD